MLTDSVLDLLYLVLDEILTSEHYEACDNILRDINVKSLDDASVLIGILAMTLPAKKLLTEREGFLRRVEEYAKQLRPPYCDEVFDSLDGLR